jgi:hypothetical protein
LLAFSNSFSVLNQLLFNPVHPVDDDRLNKGDDRHEQGVIASRGKEEEDNQNPRSPVPPAFPVNYPFNLFLLALCTGMVDCHLQESIQAYLIETFNQEDCGKKETVAIFH